MKDDEEMDLGQDGEDLLDFDNNEEEFEYANCGENEEENKFDEFVGCL
jgi:hypothetical protein